MCQVHAHEFISEINKLAHGKNLNCSMLALTVLKLMRHYIWLHSHTSTSGWLQVLLTSRGVARKVNCDYEHVKINRH